MVFMAQRFSKQPRLATQKQVRQKKMVWSVFLSVSVLVVVSALVVVNVLVSRYGDAWRLDVTQERVYALSDQTRSVLESLEEDVRIQVFVTLADPQAGVLLNLLDEYVAVSSGAVQYEIVDPERSPGLAQQYGIFRSGTLVFAQEDREEQVQGVTETELTRGLIRVTRDEELVVAFSQGHGEITYGAGDGSDYTLLSSVLRSQGYRLEQVSLATSDIPEDTDVFVIAGPRIDFSDDEVAKIQSFSERGGSVLLALDPFIEVEGAFTNLHTWLRDVHGIEREDGFVLDPQQALDDPPLSPVILDWALHGITEGIEGGFFAGVSRADRAESVPEGRRVTILASSSEGSWLERTRADGVAAIERSQEDLAGPIALVAVSEPAQDASAAAFSEVADTDSADGSAEGGSEEAASGSSSAGRVVVFGDSQFAIDVLATQNLYNQDLFVNAIDWLAAEEDLLGIRPRAFEDRTISVSAAQLRTVQWLLVVGLPLVPVAGGLVVWSVRRKRARGL